MTQEELAEEHDRIYGEAAAAVRPLIVMHGTAAAPLTEEEAGELRRGIALFERVVGMNPENWPAMWMVGKAYQRLADHESGLRWFARAHAVHPAQPDVAREASIAAMELGRPEAAVFFGRRAVEAKPEDPGLRANLALATLFCGDAVLAAEVAEEALRRDPGDAITRRIVEVCREVVEGRRACPRHAREI